MARKPSKLQVPYARRCKGQIVWSTRKHLDCLSRPPYLGLSNKFKDTSPSSDKSSGSELELMQIASSDFSVFTVGSKQPAVPISRQQEVWLAGLSVSSLIVTWKRRLLIRVVILSVNKFEVSHLLNLSDSKGGDRNREVTVHHFQNILALSYLSLQAQKLWALDSTRCWQYGANFCQISPLFFQLSENIPKEFQWWTQSSLQILLNSPACELTKVTNKSNDLFSKTYLQATSCTAFLSLSTTSWQVSIVEMGENVES